MAHKPKFTMDDYWAKMEEVRERHRVKPTVAGGSLIERLRESVKRQKGIVPTLPKVPKI